MRICTYWALVVLMVGAAGSPAAAADPEQFLLAKRGNLPVLLTAPHGGREAIPDVDARTKGTLLRDGYTLELTQAIAERLAGLLGAEPYVVAARFDRKYVEANRAEASAFEDPDARPVYEAFHRRVRQYVDELRKRYPQGAIMLDIHGQGADTRAIYRGTRNGATVKQLIKRHGTPALTGPQSILGFLESKGYKVIPASGAPGNPLEDRRFNGGYIVGTYGSHREEGIDAIQLEFGRTLRTRAATAGDLAEAIAVFYRAYLAADAPGGEHAPPGAARPAGYLGLRAYFAGRASIERSILWNLKSLGAGL